LQRTFSVLILTLLFGILLAHPLLDLPLRQGLLGGAAMLATAYWLRARWQRDPNAPEAPERRALMSLGGTAVVMGHMGACLWQAGPAMDLHSRASHAMAIDSWTLFGAALLMMAIVRAPGPAEDERDLQIAGRAQRHAYLTLVALVLSVAVWLSFGRDPLLEQMSRAMLSHILISGWIVSCMVQDITCLNAYARDHRRNAQA
jgi:uncharacterized membrane protein